MDGIFDMLFDEDFAEPRCIQKPTLTMEPTDTNIILQPTAPEIIELIPIETSELNAISIETPIKTVVMDDQFSDSSTNPDDNEQPLLESCNDDPAIPSASVSQHSQSQNDANVEASAIMDSIKIENLPKNLRPKTPASMVITLLPHQLIGLDWLVEQEVRNDRGGILADDMGLGKTVQTIALMLSHLADKNTIGRFSKTTLIIATVSLLEQWRLEILEKCLASALSVYIYHGKIKDVDFLTSHDVVLTSFPTMQNEITTIEKKKPEKRKRKQASVAPASSSETSIQQTVTAKSKKRNASFRIQEEEQGEDKKEILLAKGKVGFDDIDSETIIRGPLFTIKWYRIVLDEAHNIKNIASKSARASFELQSKYNWCLTGTPIQNKLNDLIPLLKFIRLRPFEDAGEFRARVLTPYNHGHQAEALGQVRTILSKCCLRRQKTDIVDGNPIIELPSKSIEMVECYFSPEEKDFYDILFKKIQAKFGTFLKAGTVMKNYTHVLTLLLRLRQACLHPQLVTTYSDELAAEQKAQEKEDRNMEIRDLEQVIEDMDEIIVNRLVEAMIEKSDCIICFDPVLPGKVNAVCGHALCNACTDEVLQHGECPQCRGALDKKQLVPIGKFLKKYNAEAYQVLQLDTVPLEIPEMDKTARTSTMQVEDEILKIDPNWVWSIKIKILFEKITQIRKSAPNEKVIVFSQFTGFLKLLEAPLLARKHQHVLFCGGMSLLERSEAVEKFKNDPFCNVMLISLKCGSLGLNLTCANHVILMDLWWNPAVEWQAIDRVHRIGQTRPVKVYKVVVEDTIEQKILGLQDEKTELIRGAFGEDASGSAKLELQDLKTLFGYN